MNSQFYDRVPQPQDKVSIEELTVAPYPDRFRILVKIRVTPFQVRPNLILIVFDSTTGRVVTELSIIETMHASMEFTLHIRNVQDPSGSYRIVAELFYEKRNPPQDRKMIEFVIPETDDK